MAQTDYSVADQTGLSFLADLNTTLAAIVSNNSGATEPSDTFAYMWWADTTSGILKQRNAADSAWINILTLSGIKGSDIANTPAGNVAATDVQAAIDELDADISTNTSDILDRAELSGGTSANFTAMPQVGGDPIVESGSNADGEWTRWADGTQTAVKRQEETGVSIAGGTGFVAISSVMGAAFIANPAYGLTGRFVAGNGNTLYGFFSSSFSSDIALFSNIGTSPSGAPPSWNTTGTITATSYFVDICATGRWK